MSMDIHRRERALWKPWAVILRPRHPAGRVIGPVAVEPDHAPFHAPADAEPARSLEDRIVDRRARLPSETRATPLQNRRGIACAAQGRNAASRMRSMPTISRFEFQNSPSLWPNLELICPSTPAVVAQRHQRVVARAGQAEVELKPARGARGRGAKAGDPQEQVRCGFLRSYARSPKRATVPRSAARVKGRRTKGRGLWLTRRALSGEIRRRRSGRPRRPWRRSRTAAPRTWRSSRAGRGP